VDEADSVKVGDDGSIARLHGNQVQIIRGFPLDQLGIAATLDFSGSNFTPNGLYRDGNLLVVYGGAWEPDNGETLWGVTP